MNLPDAYRHCEERARAALGSFAMGFRMLPADRRSHLYALYAFARRADDLADDPAPDPALRREAIARYRGDLHAALAGTTEDPVLLALADTTRRFGIRPELYDELLDGAEQDLEHVRIAGEEEITRYCYRVASTIGLISIEIFGYEDAETPGYAADLGQALQRTNILRDVAEDLERDRIYLPADALQRHGVTEEDLRAGTMTAPLRALLAEFADGAQAYFDRAQPLFERIAPESRVCPRAFHDVYAALLRRIRERAFDVFGERVCLSTTEKMAIAGRLLVGGGRS